MPSWRALLDRKRLDRELEAELRDHLDRLTAEYMRRGCDLVEARRRARAAFGSLDRTREDCRDLRRVGWLEDGVQDLRYAARVLRASPGFTLVAVLSLALGIGANAAIFSVADAVLLKSLPLAAPDRLVLLGEQDGSRTGYSFSTPAVEAFAQSASLAGICAFRPWPGFNVDGPGGPELVQGQLLSSRCFNLLHIPMLRGRGLAGGDDVTSGSTPGMLPGPVGSRVVVVSYPFWQHQLGGRDDVIGATLRIQGAPFTIVGVTAPAFSGFEPGRSVAVSVPLSLDAASANPDARWLRVLARVRDGVPLAEAGAELDGVWRRYLEQSAPGGRPGRLLVRPGAQGLNDMGDRYRRSLGVLMAGVCVLLLIACANLAALLFARAQVRQHEIALRMALGARRGRVVRQLMTEALVLAGLGGAAGLGLAVWASGGLVAAIAHGQSGLALALPLDGRLLAFTALVSALAALAFGTLPSLGASRDPGPRAQAATRSQTGATASRGRALIAAQVACSLALLAGAGLLVRTLGNLYAYDAGFDRDHVLLASVRPAVGGVPDVDVPALYRALRERFEALPGVRSATLSMDTPSGGVSWSASVLLPGPDRGGVAEAVQKGVASDEQVQFNFIGPRYFETVGIPLLAGRPIDGTDTGQSPPVVVLSRSVAREYFPDGSAVGRYLEMGGTLTQVIGVVGDVTYQSVRAGGTRMAYRPYLQQFESMEQLTFAIRTGGDPSALVTSVRAVLHDLAPSVPLYSVTTLASQFDASIATERVMADVAAAFAGVALLLVAIGVYGTLAYAATRRRRELGVRLAVGAAPGHITRLLVAGALLPVAAGAVVGLPLALLTGRALHAMLFDVGTADPATYAACLLVLAAVAASAAALPAVRASRASPVEVLREE